MSHAPKTEEIDRFMVSIAADDVAGGRRNVSYLGEIVPESRRAYLYARPAGEDVRFSIEKLEAALEASGFPHLVDWGRSSERRGLRYGTRLIDVPEELRPFAGREAEAEWRAWRADLRGEQDVLVSAAFGAVGQEVPVSLSAALMATNLSDLDGSVAEGARGRDPKDRQGRDSREARADRPDGEIPSNPAAPEVEKAERQDRIRAQALRIAATKERGTPAHPGRVDRSEGR